MVMRNMESIMEMGRISARGQIAIPAEIRRKLKMRDGEKVMFMTEGNAIVMKKLDDMSWEEVTRPLVEAAKKSGFKESEVPRIIERMRKKRRKEQLQTQTY